MFFLPWKHKKRKNVGFFVHCMVKKEQKCVFFLSSKVLVKAERCPGQRWVKLRAAVPGSAELPFVQTEEEKKIVPTQYFITINGMISHC